MENLTKVLGGPTLHIKRDDCTGLATGGNKVRKLEFLIGQALQQGVDTIVTQGAVQSNHARQTAAAASAIVGCMPVRGCSWSATAKMHPRRSGQTMKIQNSFLRR